LEIFSISHERIYQYILEDKRNGGKLYNHLRHKNKKYRKRYGSPARLCSYVNFDNGSEFAGHEAVSIELEADFFFAHPYSSWERGLNENTNGLVRQYLKKSTPFTHVKDEALDIIASKLNNRPRKTLGYKTPKEVFLET
jgi:IS30 family transposase